MNKRNMYFLEQPDNNWKGKMYCPFDSEVILLTDKVRSFTVSVLSVRLGD